MKNIHTLILPLLATLLLSCRTPQPQNSSSTSPVSHITLAVTCSDPTMFFTGTIVRDGNIRQVSGTGSGTFDITGNEIVASFKKSGAKGRISIEGSEAGVKLGNASTDRNAGGVRAEFHRTPAVQQGFSSF